jgi:hypothetical protein
MVLTTEEFGDFPDVGAADLNEILADDCFGKFVVLSASDSDFIQAACDWSPSEKCAAFMQLHDSDPWVLEYRDGSTNRQYRAAGNVTLHQVRQSFARYLSNDPNWRAAFTWQQLDV